MSSGRVTVIVPTYQHQEYLRCSVLSILNSTIPVEVIVVPVKDDRESIDELDRLRKAWPDANIRVIVSDKADPFYQMQLGLDNCQTEFFTIIGSDDFMLPNAVRRMLEIAVWSNATNPVVALSYALTDANLNITSIETVKPFSLSRMMKCSIIPDTALVKTQNARLVGGFLNGGPDFGYLNHYAFFNRLIKLPGTQVILSPDIGCLYRQLPGSRHSQRYVNAEAIRIHKGKVREVARYYWGD
jgi:glycosyltransferase involved in cell wall biosynthesis